MKENIKFLTIDGNEACARASYLFTEISTIYPITPSSNMAELIDVFSKKNKTNLFNGHVLVKQMQSEAGAAGAMHGSLQTGSLTTTYTASQGLLLMIPNIYKMVGEFLPGVIHVAARSIATRALSIFGDHQDIYATRQTGIGIIASSSVQEAHDLACLTHLISISSSSPFIHFFDGFRTSHEIQKIKTMDESKLKKLIDFDNLKKFKKNALDPITNPITRGGNENDDIYFQAREAQNEHFNNIILKADSYFKEISKLTSKEYAPFVYYGAKNPDKLIIAMGSITKTIEKSVDVLNENGENVGCIKVMMYRPFSKKHLLDTLPKTVKKIAVLDRTKEDGSSGEPLFLDVVSTLKDKNIFICGGRYGLSSKNTKVKDINAVFKNLNQKEPKNNFTLSITDDLTNLSLKEVSYNNDFEKDYFSSLIYGFGGDGSVSASKSIIKIIGQETSLNVQGYFAYDSRKNGSLTTSNLRISKKEIKAPFYIEKADFISCAKETYIVKYSLHEKLKENSIFLLNTSFSKEKFLKTMPELFLKTLREKNVSLYTIDANKIAKNLNLNEKINIIMQSCFFHLNKDLFKNIDFKKKIENFIIKNYSNSEKLVIEGNLKSIEAYKKLKKIDLNLNIKGTSIKKTKEKNYFTEFVDLISNKKGDSIPTSTFKKYGLLDGSFKNNIAVKEKRNLANEVPIWEKEKCIQCNRCVVACPHATIRSFLLNKEEEKNSPIDLNYKTLKVIGKSVDNKFVYKLQVDRENCVGCGLCVEVCPTKALSMEKNINKGEENFLTDYLYNKVEYKTGYFENNPVKEIGFHKPYFEVSGACAGCGETPYYRLLSQLFGNKLLIGNATGCSSIYGGSTPFSPFTLDKEKRGIAWANSLFEDNAEFSFGMLLTYKYRKLQIEKIINDNLSSLEKVLKEKLVSYLKEPKDDSFINNLIKDIRKSKNDKIKNLLNFKDSLYQKSIWSIGGDGWAYDIGFSGIDHVLSSGENINILVLDTQVYSNTGGQSSKATPLFANAKFSYGGKKLEKKNLAQISLNYKNVYVAQISLGANPIQTINALKEAESHDGPSIVIAYGPCIEHKIVGGMKNQQKIQLLASQSGFFPIFKYNPKTKKMNMDSPTPNYEKYKEFILSQKRFSSSLSEKDLKDSFDSLLDNYKNIKKFNS